MKTTRTFTPVALIGLGLISLCLPPVCRAESLYPDNVVPAARGNDAPNWELGTVFRPRLAGTVKEVRVFSLAEESGEHQVRIWRNADNTVVAGPLTWVFGGDDAWITLDIPDVPAQAGQDYTISISSPAEGWYPANAGYFASSGNNGQYLSYPQSAGVFNETAGQRPASSFGNAAYLRDIVFEPDLSGTIMQVNWKGREIADGSANTSLAAGTDLGGKGLDAGWRELTYAITNLGQTALQLTGSPLVSISGTHTNDFVVTTQPSATVPGNGSTAFTIRFDPLAIGPRLATVAIAHADTPGDPYEFALRGEGLGGGAGILGNDSEGAFARNIDDAQIHGNRFQAPVDMRITELRAKVLELTGTFQCAVYSDTNGLTDRLLRGSEPVVNATNGWNRFPLTTPLDLTAGDSYWLVIWSDTVGARIQADPVGGAYWGSYPFIDFGGVWPESLSLPDLIVAEPRTYCLYAEGAALSSGPGPELDVRGNGKLIVSGDGSPSLLDGTEFGNLSVAGGTQERTFTLQNVGDAPLELNGNPKVTFTGAHASDFTVTVQPISPIAPGSSTTFTARFDPSVRGLRSATTSIPNNDLSEGNFQFAVQGAGFLTGRESIWPDSKTGRDIDFDGTYYELGTVFRSSVAGKITHLRVYSLTSETGDHTARLWRNDTEEVIGGPYTWTYGGFTGWITLDIPDVPIEAEVDYTVSVSTGTSAKRNYPNLAADLLTAGGNGQSLSYPVNAGVFTETREGRPSQSFNGGNYLRDVIFIPAGVTVDLPNLDVKGNGILIADGTVAATSDNGTDFGQAAIASGIIEHSFTVANAGTAPLNLSSTPIVALSGPAAADFTVVTQPGTPIPPGGQVTFTLRFSPKVLGARNATVSIENDSDENPYDFAITGLGTEASAQPRIVEVKPDWATGNLTLRWEGAGAQFQVEKAAAVNGPYQSLGSAQATRVYTDTGALRVGTAAFYRVRALPN